MIRTWNLQGVSTRDQKPKQIETGGRTLQRKELGDNPDIRNQNGGRRSYMAGEDETRPAFIQSKRCGVILHGDALKSWFVGNQQKSRNERVTAVQINNL